MYLTSGVDEARFWMAAAPAQFSSPDTAYVEEEPLEAKFHIRSEPISVNLKKNILMNGTTHNMLPLWLVNKPAN